MSNPKPDEHIDHVSKQEEEELLARQRQRKVLAGIILGVLAVGIMLLTIYLLVSTGYHPFEEQELFRSN